MNYTATDRRNVLVMHHDPLLRAGLVAALRQHPAFDVFVDGDAAASDMDSPRMHVVIADYGQAMQFAAGAAHGPLATARILILTSNDREADIRRAVEAGVHGYLLLGGALSELIEGVTMVARGMRYLAQSVAQRMADSLTRASLTLREVEVLQLVVAGESNKAIARQLRIELGTVKSHMTAIMTKLGATSRTQAASIATARGLVEETVLVQHAPLLPRTHSNALRPQFA